jgi:hypothetical protein
VPIASGEGSCLYKQWIQSVKGRMMVDLTAERSNPSGCSSQYDKIIDRCLVAIVTTYLVQPRYAWGGQMLN